MAIFPLNAKQCHVCIFFSFSWYKGGIWWWIFKLRAVTSLCIAFIDSVENLIQGLRLQRWSFIYIKYSNTCNFIVLKFALLYIRVVIITMSTWITIRQINQQKNFGIAQWNWTNKITMVHSSRHWYGNCMTIWHRTRYWDTHPILAEELIYILLFPGLDFRSKGWTDELYKLLLQDWLSCCIVTQHMPYLVYNNAM